MVVIAAKIVGTALIARIFVLTQPSLLRIGWFAWAYARFLAFKARIHEVIESTGVYRTAHLLRLKVRAALAEFSSRRRTVWASRWRAAIRLSRKWRQSKEER
jgi:hypothetical protein